MPRCSVSRRCWARTSSPMVTDGKAPWLNGGGVLLGEDENPPPNCPGTTMKYLVGSSPRPSPIQSSVVAEVPEYQCGTRMTLSFAALSVPCVLYASLAPRSVYPDSSAKSPSSRYWWEPWISSE